MKTNIKLRKARKLMGYSQSQAAKLSGLSQTRISKLETKEHKLIPKKYLFFLVQNGININLIFSDDKAADTNKVISGITKDDYLLIGERLKTKELGSIDDSQKKVITAQILSDIEKLQERISEIERLIKASNTEI
jgi:transcriptional regulator with XRE-family HTH domain